MSVWATSPLSEKYKTKTFDKQYMKLSSTLIETLFNYKFIKRSEIIYQNRSTSRRRTASSLRLARRWMRPVSQTVVTIQTRSQALSWLLWQTGFLIKDSKAWSAAITNRFSYKRQSAHPAHSHKSGNCCWCCLLTVQFGDTFKTMRLVHQNNETPITNQSNCYMIKFKSSALIGPYRESRPLIGWWAKLLVRTLES